MYSRDEHTEIFEEHRPLLFTLAYETLGRVTDAEDVIQDAYLRWRDVNLERVHDPEGYLATAVTHLSLNRLDSARERREEYPGPWLPEPLPAEDARVETAVRSEALTTAFLMVLESLTPEQRVIYLLREVFTTPRSRTSWRRARPPAVSTSTGPGPGSRNATAATRRHRTRRKSSPNSSWPAARAGTCPA